MKWQIGIIVVNILVVADAFDVLFDPSNYIHRFVLKSLVFMTVMEVYLYLTNEKQEILDVLRK